MTVQATHNDIMREIGALSQQAENLEVRGDGHDDRLNRIEHAVALNAATAARVEAALAEIRADIAAIKAKVLAWEMFKARVITAASVAAAAVASGASFLWWLVGDRITHFFKGPAA